MFSALPSLFLSISSQAAPAIMLPDSSFDLQITPYLAILEDKTNSLTIDDILTPKKQSEFTPNNRENLRFSISSSSYWLRFSIINPHAKKQSLVFSISNSRLDNIDLYEYKSGQINHHSSGSSAVNKAQGSHRQAYPFVIEVKEKAHQRRKDHQVQLEINMERLGSKILELHKVYKSFGDKKILDGFDYVFKRGERVGIIGKNGTGKSSFLNIITGTSELDGGKVVLGETVKYGYYTQAGIEIKEGQKVIEVVKEFGEFIPLTKGRKISASQLLERFLFDKKKQYDFVEKLSGGEQKRLYLCAVLIQNPNFLILDEPTNDSDVVTLNVLENFLLDFPGNLIVVSHDRYFMDKIVDALFVFRGEGVVENFPGNYSDFRAYDSSLPATPKKEKTEVVKEVIKTKKGSLTFNENREFGLLESDIERLQNRKQTIESQFLNVEIASDKIAEKSKELQQIIEDLETKEERWFELSMKLEG